MTKKTMLMPGVWADEDGDLHFSVPDLLEAFGWPDDADHRAQVDQIIRDLCAQHYPTAPITNVE